MKTILFGVMVAMATAAPATAASFDGPYAGVSVGYNHDKVGPALDRVPLTRDVERDSAMIGIFAGYDWTVGSHLVLGAEVALNGPADNKLRVGQGNDATTVDPRLAVYLSARAGYRINDKTLLYVRGGCASVRIHSSVGQAAVISSSLDGWHADAGFEYAVSKHVNARVEYRYTDVGGSRSNYLRQQAMAGVSYRF